MSGLGSGEDAQALMPAFTGRQLAAQLRRGRRPRVLIALPDLLDEQLLHQSVRVPVVRIMVALAGLPNVRQLRQTQRPASLAEGLERIFGLPRHDDIADQAEEVTFSDRIGEVA